GQILIGFAMETENLINNASEKLAKKNADYIVANSLREEGAGFGTDTNHVIILSKDAQQDVALASKEEVARIIFDYCVRGK
ncbi:MAG: phosphopantothenoylcysteine decarboxylase, partial [Erysipelotrichaceae bacterium]|nr:phosphopantothenoylcysteine decarboxylase [Erysipelotrichaceae bacterium]